MVDLPPAPETPPTTLPGRGMGTYADGLRYAVTLLNVSPQAIRLAAGEMTAAEMRAVKAVLAWRQRVISDAAYKADGTPSPAYAPPAPAVGQVWRGEGEYARRITGYKMMPAFPGQIVVCFIIAEYGLGVRSQPLSGWNAWVARTNARPNGDGT